MPLTRYQLRNEFSLADPDLYGSADKDDAEALLEGVAMAGLVGVLRQLGDLAEFAAEIFHDLHEEVMATAARGHTLMVRVQQLEAEVPAIEKEFLSRTKHSSFYTNAGVDWHPNLHMEQNLVTHGDLPRCVRDSYEECWGPPRLFLLDKFDVAGAGACLKRYTDPSFFKNEMDTFENSHLEVQRDKKFRKAKKKGSRWKNADTESLPISHVKLHQLFLEESIENAFSDPARLVKLKKRQFNGSPLAPKSGKSYMEKFLETPSPDNVAAIYDTTINLPLLKMTSDNSSESGLDIVEIRAVSPVTTLTEMKESTSISADEQEMVTNACMENLNREASIQAAVKIPELAAADDRNGTLHGLSRVKPEQIVDGGKDNRGDLDGDHGDDVTSEAENFMDALATIESEIETDNECQPRNNCRFLTDRRYGADSDLNEEQLESRTRSSDSQSFGISYISDYGDSSSRKSKSSFSTKKSQSSFSSKKSHSSFSSSDTISNVTENVASDDEVAADSYTCLENRATDEVHASCVQLPTHVETQGSNSNKIHEDQLFDNGEVSSTSRVTETNFTFVEMKPGTSTVAKLLVEHKLNRELSDDIKLSSDVFDTNKNGLNINDSSEVAADLYEKLVFCGKLQPNESDIGAKSVTSDASVHKMRTMEPDLHSENDDNCLVEVKRIDLAEEDCVANSGNLVAGSQESLVTAAKDLLPCSTLPEAEACLDKTVLPNKLDDIMPAEPVFEAVAIMEASIESEIVAELVDTPVGHVTDEHQLDAFVDVSQEEVGCSKLDEKLDLAEISRVVDDEETGKSSIKVDDREESPAAFDATAKCQEDSGDNNHATFEDPSTEAVRPDDTAVSATVAVGSGISGSHSLNSIHSVLRDPMVSGKCLSDADKTHQPAMEIAEHTSPSVVESGGQWYEVGAPAIESDSTEIITGSIDFFNLKGTVPNSAPGEQIDRSALDEVAYVPSSDQHGELRVLPSVHPWESSEDVTSSLSSQLLKPGTCLEQSLYMPTGQLNDGRFPRDEASTVSPKVLALSSDLEIDSDKLELDPSTSLHSAYALLDDTSIARAEEVPPLPPLPPMQWRIGKAQQHSLASQNGLAEHDEGLFSMPFQYTTEPKAQYELSVSEAGSLLPSHLYLSAASKEEKLSHDSGEIVGDFVHPALGISNCLDNRNEEFCGSSSEKAESSNPFFTEPGLPNERHEYSYPVIESGVESCKAALPLPIDEDTTPGHEISSLLEHPTQTSLDMVMHTLEGGSVQHGSQEQEELVENYLDTSIIPPLTYQEQPPSRVKEQPPYSVEEQPPNRVEVQAQNRVEKQPPNQFEEVTSFKIEEMPPNKIEERPSGEVSGHPQNNENMQLPCEFEEQTSKNVQNQAPRDINEQPCAQVEVQHPPEAEKQSQHGMLTSGGEIAPVFNAFALPGLSTSETFFPPHSLALLPISEAGKADGHPTVKLPRPRNPLIDAVAAVDKSKLRKVSDRVQPPIGPKADERGSLLEQIRTKSFNLKSAVGTRPSIQNIQGPRTNLRLAAILEKANAIRQATTGSDEDEDSWSDS